jgi:hypothetical protein
MSTLIANVRNLSQGDARFLQDMISLFCDVERKDLVSDLRSGAVVAAYRPGSGELLLRDAINLDPIRSHE